MRLVVVLIGALTALAGTAEAQAPVRGHAFCWDLDFAGTDVADALDGTAAPDHIAAYGGDDTVALFGDDDCAAAGAGDDTVHLGPGNDQAEGGSGADVLLGGPGDDILLGGLGADRSDGGEGDDLLRDERGDADPDVLTGGEGHDVLRAANAGPDAVECGPGWDVAIVDASDTLSQCDDVRVARLPNVTAAILRTGVRPKFVLRWKSSDLAGPQRVRTALVDHPSARPGCGMGSWHRRGGATDLRLTWRGLLGACQGRYVFRLIHIGTDRVACERLTGAPSAGCPRTEVLGTVALTVL